MKWITALGLILQFLAFWLAAPELLGESTMKRLQKGLEKLLTAIPLILLILVILGYGFGFAVRGIYLGLQAAEGTTFTGAELTQFYVSMGISTLLYFLLIAFYKKITHYLKEKLAIPLINKLIQHQDARKQALVGGAILFSLGFLLQLATTVLS